MENVIFAFMGPSGSGKSTLVAEMLRRFPDRLAVIKSITTRPKRSAEDDMNYRFVTRGEVRRILEAGRLIQGVEYAGEFYGNDRHDVEEVFASGRHGINALVEAGVRNFRSKGYRISAIRVEPVGEIDGRSEERRRIDQERAREVYMPDLLVQNRFEPGGLEQCIDSVAIYIGAYMDAMPR